MKRLISLLVLASLIAAQDMPKAKPEKQDPKKKPPKEEEATKQEQPHPWASFKKGAWAKYKSTTKYDQGNQSKEYTLKLTAVTDRGCQVLADDVTGPGMLDVPVDHKALPSETEEGVTFKDKGTESVKCGNKSYKCNVKEYVRKAPALTETLTCYKSETAPEFIVKKVQVIKDETQESKTTIAITKVGEKVKVNGQDLICYTVQKDEVVGKSETTTEEQRCTKVPGHLVRRHSYVKGSGTQGPGTGSDILEELEEFGLEGP